MSEFKIAKTIDEKSIANIKHYWDYHNEAHKEQLFSMLTKKGDSEALAMATTIISTENSLLERKFEDILNNNDLIEIFCNTARVLKISHDDISNYFACSSSGIKMDVEKFDKIWGFLNNIKKAIKKEDIMIFYRENYDEISELI